MLSIDRSWSCDSGCPGGAVIGGVGWGAGGGVGWGGPGETIGAGVGTGPMPGAPGVGVAPVGIEDGALDADGDADDEGLVESIGFGVPAGFGSSRPACAAPPRAFNGNSAEECRNPGPIRPMVSAAVARTPSVTYVRQRSIFDLLWVPVAWAGAGPSSGV